MSLYPSIEERQNIDQLSDDEYAATCAEGCQFYVRPQPPKLGPWPKCGAAFVQITARHVFEQTVELECAAGHRWSFHIPRRGVLRGRALR